MRQHHGVAGPAFVERLAAERCADEDGLRERIERLRSRFIERVLDGAPEADGQVRATASRFGLAAAAGELASTWGVLPWAAGTSASAALAAFQGWVAERGTGSGEDRQALQVVRAFLAAHGESRFALLISGAAHEPPATDGFRVLNRAGFRRVGPQETEFLILKESWNTDVCKSLEPKRAAQALASAGFLRTERGRLTLSTRLPGLGQTRVYAVSSRVLDSE